MTIRWHELDEFPDYAVSEHGDIVNMKTGYPRKTSINQHGVLRLSLYDDSNRLFTRSIAVLVANAFLPKEQEHFDTPIHLDGDRLNCRVDNLMWRPRWFAIAYHKQFRFDTFHTDQRQFVDIETGDYYYGIKDVCTKNGLYYFDVHKSAVEETFVPFTYQEFRVVQE